MPLPLQCTWDVPISIDGLNKEDKDRINEIGFEGWITEISEKITIPIRRIKLDAA